MSDQIEVDYDRELETMIEEMQAGRGRFDHLTTIARVVYTERRAVTNFAEHQGEHKGLLEALVVKVDGIDGKVDSLQTEVGGLRTEMNERFASIDERFTSIDERFTSIDQRFTSIDQRFDAMEKSMDARFASMEQRIVAAVGGQLETFTDRVLNGVKAQLEEYGVPISPAERRGYRP